MVVYGLSPKGTWYIQVYLLGNCSCLRLTCRNRFYCMAFLLTKTPIENIFYFLWGFLFLFGDLCYLCVIKVHKQTSLNMKQKEFTETSGFLLTVFGLLLLWIIFHWSSFLPLRIPKGGRRKKIKKKIRRPFGKFPKSFYLCLTIDSFTKFIQKMNIYNLDFNAEKKNQKSKKVKSKALTDMEQKKLMQIKRRNERRMVGR